MSPFKGIHSLVIAAATALAVMGGVTSAQASVVFDFAAAASGNEGPFDNSAAYTTVGGIKVQAFASNTFGDERISRAYLDDVFNERPVGAGVCSAKILANKQCKIASDDNVTSGETLTLSFFDAATMNPLAVVLDPTFFRDANHFGTFVMGDMIDITDASGLTTFQLPLNGEFTTQLTGDTFDFTYYNTEFYIGSVTVTPVPLPAALPLFLSALAGLALLGRRQRKKAAA